MTGQVGATHERILTFRKSVWRGPYYYNGSVFKLSLLLRLLSELYVFLPVGIIFLGFFLVL